MESSVAGLVGDGAGDVDDIACDAVVGEVLLRGEVTLRPLASGCVRADNEHGDGCDCDDYKRDNEGDPPGSMGREMLGGDERVEDRRHEEVGDTTSRITKAASEGISSAHDVLVEETSCPDLARDEGPPENANEETEGKETLCIRDGAGEYCGDGAHKKAASEGVTRTEVITRRTGHKTYEETDICQLGSPFKWS